ncbi:coiled-coil domain-containing protein 171-like isoform X2 [Pomacea canaliculata]|uniref:coiled-coil domain-containing protein 171-like isoform X2 n=1 Tax=Pomacea canaliculata TaxID=400727 RepID=UPI000D72C993|nr:coiled-coil domain-containing protein 171-like isoform X2 [Pomacea canaliculata]
MDIKETAVDLNSNRMAESFSDFQKDFKLDGPTSHTILNTSGFSVYDVNQIRIQNKQLKLDLQAEQETVAQLRKRLNAAEKQKLEVTSQCNKEIASLENQLAKQRALVEKGEATRHNVEFEMTKVQRELSQTKQQSLQRESALQEVQDELKHKISDLNDEIRALQQNLQKSKENAEDQGCRLQAEISDRDQEVARLKAEMDVCRSERDRLAVMCQQQEATIGGFGEKVHEFELEHKNQSDDLQRALAEIRFFKEREERLKKDLENTITRLKSLEENIEAERAAHLESKFNSEIVQLRVRDLEGSLEVEKSANAEANRAVERLTKQIRELEQIYDDERKIKKDIMNKHDKLEKEYLSTRRQLGGEIEEKKTVIGSLSKELEVHQKNFNELKTELGKAKKRQAFLEDSYGTAFKELEYLLLNFDVEDKNKKTKIVISKKESSQEKKSVAPSALVEKLKHTLTSYRRKLDTTAEELSKSRKLCEKLTKEADTFREMIKTKDKSLEDTHKNYTRTAKELNKTRASYNELEAMVSKLRSSLETTSTSHGKDRNRIQELSEEIMKLVKRHKQDNEDKVACLHGLYQRLTAARVLLPQQDKPPSYFSWNDLAEMVYEQVVSLVESLHQAEEKTKTMNENLRSRDEVVTEMQKSHEEQLSRLTALTREREASWTKQKEEMEQHYKQLLADLQLRTKSQAMADQAWEKMRATGGVQQGLETECSTLRQQLSEAQTQSRSLLTACALLCGAVYPLYARMNALSSQRHLLEEQMVLWDNCRDRARYLVNVLTAELSQPEHPRVHDRKLPRKHLLGFRVGVIVVLAAHRLVRLGQLCCRCFVAYDTASAGNGIVVLTGGVKLPQILAPVIRTEDVSMQDSTESTLPLASSLRVPVGQAHLLGWLTSSALAETVTVCMADITDAAHSSNSGGTPIEHRALVAAARSSFSKLMDHLAQFFPSVKLQPVAALRDRRSLTGRLTRSLARLLEGMNVVEKNSLVSSQELMVALQNHILDFIQRLHSVEIERRQLLTELGNLKTQIAGLGSAAEAADGSGDRPIKFVVMDKFEKVCNELNEALKREQTAQQILNEQSKQLQELTLRLDLCDTQGVQRQQTLSEAMIGLSEMKDDLRRREQELRQAKKQILQMEFQRKSLQTNLRDAEEALHTAAKDKEILAHYLKSVEAALEEVKQQLLHPQQSGSATSDSAIVMSKLLLSTDLIPQDIGKAGPELIACQNLVGAFVDVHHQSMTRLRTLEEERVSLHQHVNSLKRELSDAVHREYNPDLPTHDNYDLVPSISRSDISYKDEFRPLREDSEASFSATSMPSSPEKSLSKSAFRTVNKSPRLLTPKTAAHKSRARLQVSSAR